MGAAGQPVEQSAPPSYVCNCTAGWAGEHCEVSDPCITLNPCIGGECQTSSSNVLGYTCACFADYRGEPNCDEHIGAFTKWEGICISATIVSILPVPWMIKRFRRTLDDLEDPGLPEHRNAVGPFGLFMFFYGVFDLVLDVSLCATLSSCGQFVLFCCCMTTLVVTTLMTWSLGYMTLRRVVTADTRTGSPARRWLVDNPSMGPLIVLASSSRLNSMAILRLRICRTMILDFPDSDGHRYFHFLRNSGMYHFWVEDIPHALLCVALLLSTGDEGVQACTDHGQTKTVHLPGGRDIELPIADTDIAWASLVCSIGSMLFGIVSKTMQVLTVTIAREPEIGSPQLEYYEGSGTLRASVAEALLSRLKLHGFVDDDTVLERSDSAEDVSGLTGAE